MKKVIIVSLSILLVVMLFGCGDTGATEDILTRIGWQSGTEGRTLYASNDVDNRNLSRSVESDQLFSDYFTSLGTKIDSFTPEKFKIPVTHVSLISSEGLEQVELFGVNVVDTELTVDDLHADFTATVSTNDPVAIEAGLYDSLIISIQAANRDISVGGTDENPEYTFDLVHEIIVEIPGYTDVELPDIGTVESPERTYLGENKFQFTWEKLNPIFWSSNTSIEYLVYNANEEGSNLIIPGVDGVGDILYVADYSTDPNAGADSTNGPVMVSSFSAIDLTQLVSDEEGAIIVTYKICLDLIDMIEIYDNDTENDKTDDIVVFADNFWNRFSLVIE